MEMNIQNLTVDEVEELDIDMRKAALAAHLGIDVEDIREASYGDNQFEADGAEYLVLTDDEADRAAQEDIEQSLWAFNASFLADFTGLPQAVFEALQPQCESANDAILQIIKGGDGIEEFAQQAISADGRGHFLNRYDGNEHEQGQFYIYRTN